MIVFVIFGKWNLVLIWINGVEMSLRFRLKGSLLGGFIYFLLI